MEIKLRDKILKFKRYYTNAIIGLNLVVVLR